VQIHDTAGEPTQAGQRMASHAVRSHPRPTAVLAMSDSLAVGVVIAAREAGLLVPDDLSVVGFDDTAPTASTPALTTVHQSHHDKGRLAARAALHADPLDRLELPTNLIVRNSTARPT
jgi:DNA-binding LacI/PurR family transcriptional regulator